MGDVLGESLMEELQTLFVEENLVKSFHRVSEMFGMKCLVLNLAPDGYSTRRGSPSPHCTP